MNVHPDCFPCFLRQTVTTLGFSGIDSDRKIRIIQEVLDVIKTSDTSRPPAYATTFIYRKIREFIGEDPYREIKYKYNEKVMSIYPELRKRVFGSKDLLWTASRMAIAGNIIDFGIFKSIDIDSAIQRAMNDDIEVDDYNEFKKGIEKNSHILYLLDNSGEIVFDMLLIEVLKDMNKDVTAVVKGVAVINDATMDDIEQIGLKNICRVIDNGSDAVGTIIQWCSDEFKSEFNSASLIISKGQGNFETVVGNNKNVFFLFQAKCNVVANELGVKNGAMLLKHN